MITRCFDRKANKRPLLGEILTRWEGVIRWQQQQGARSGGVVPLSVSSGELWRGHQRCFTLSLRLVARMVSTLKSVLINMGVSQTSSNGVQPRRKYFLSGRGWLKLGEVSVLSSRNTLFLMAKAYGVFNPYVVASDQEVGWTKLKVPPCVIWRAVEGPPKMFHTLTQSHSCQESNPREFFS